MPQKILITGGCGFIGTNFIHLLYTQYPDLEIFNLDSLDFKITGNNHDYLLPERYHFIQGSILDKDLVDKLFRENKFDQVINFAAKSHVDNSIFDPSSFVTTNVVGTQILLHAALKYETSKFVHISTDEVYGSLDLDSSSTLETANIQPNNPYSASKAGADCLVRSYHQTYQLPVIITRSSNNFGPYQYPEKFIPVVISNAIWNKAIPVYGSGINVRDWIFVEDNCRAIDLVRNKGAIGEIYNIPGAREITNIELAKSILKILDKPESLIEYVTDRKGHDFRYSMNGTKLEALGFSMDDDFEGKLKVTVAWYMQNTHWLLIKKIDDTINEVINK